MTDFTDLPELHVNLSIRDVTWRILVAARDATPHGILNPETRGLAIDWCFAFTILLERQMLQQCGFYEKLPTYRPTERGLRYLEMHRVDRALMGFRNG